MRVCLKVIAASQLTITPTMITQTTLDNPDPAQRVVYRCK